MTNLLWWVQFDSFAFKESPSVFVTVGNTVDTAVDEHVDSVIQVGPVITVTEVVLGQSLALKKFTLRRSGILHDRFNE